MSSQPDTIHWKHRVANLTTTSQEQIRINYIDCPPLSTNTTPKGTILLIHGFPQTSYQFRHVITPLSNAGYRIIAPDYRGAGQSSKPALGYTKTQMAEDLHLLITSHLGITSKIHVVGHDIGGMIAVPYATRYADDVASLIWGECPMPGTRIYEEVKTSLDVFHFLFHRVPDLPEMLLAGREREYIKHFFDKQSFNSGAITLQDLEHYAVMYSQPGAMRAALEVYRAFETDAEEWRGWVEENGKVKVPAMFMVGKEFLLAPYAEVVKEDVQEGAEIGVVEESGHYLAEENPERFVEVVLGFVGKHVS